MTSSFPNFTKSLKQFAETLWDDPDWYLRPFDDNAVGDPNSLNVVAWRALAHAYINKSLQHYEKLITVCESPIEEMMLCALCIVCHENAESVRYRVHEHEFGDLEQILDSFQIEPQAVIEKYRVDFRLTYSAYIRDEPQGSSFQWRSQAVIIECDGHAFHEKTPNQAQRDKERDRHLQKLGYKVFHYTGREIWRDIFKCAHEAVKSIQESVGVPG
ncbi:MAG: DUF559 domain-containing protein [Snowella sp.]|nr:DUF559 domain-containing protein [Snowella sp.]